MDAEVVTNLGEDIPLTVDRNGQIINLKLRPRLETRGNETFGVIDIQPPRTYIGVAEVQKGTPAESAGLQNGDKITAINDTPVTGWLQFRRPIEEGHEVTLTVQRGQETLTIKGTPQKGMTAMFSASSHSSRPGC